MSIAAENLDVLRVRRFSLSQIISLALRMFCSNFLLCIRATGVVRKVFDKLLVELATTPRVLLLHAADEATAAFAVADLINSLPPAQRVHVPDEVAGGARAKEVCSGGICFSIVCHVFGC